MAKFHINPESGDPGECAATQGRCPYGSVEEHYGSAAEARAAYEVLMSAVAVKPSTGNVLDKNVFVSVLSSSQDVLTEQFAGDLTNGLEPGVYAASYYDEKAGKDRFVKLKVDPSGHVEYSRIPSFRVYSSPSSEKTQAAVSDLRTNLNLLVGKSDPSYCHNNSIDRITLLETANEIRRHLAKFDWESAEGATRGKVAFEDLEWVIDHDLELAEREEKEAETKALAASKEIVSSFLTELNNRRS